jgi:lipopolysaccharide/colanic/teichoic acid biosynthesis glycosyltransferase
LSRGTWKLNYFSSLDQQVKHIEATIQYNVQYIEKHLLLFNMHTISDTCKIFELHFFITLIITVEVI